MSAGSTGGAVPSIPLAHLRSIMEPRPVTVAVQMPNVRLFDLIDKELDGTATPNELRELKMMFQVRELQDIYREHNNER